MNIFDNIQKLAQVVVTNHFGSDAVWIPSWGGVSYNARVLLVQPTRKESVEGDDYTALRPRMEYFNGDFPGLFDSVLKNTNENITIDGEHYLGFAAERKYDGASVIIFLEKQP